MVWGERGGGLPSRDATEKASPETTCNPMPLASVVPAGSGDCGKLREDECCATTASLPYNKMAIEQQRWWREPRTISFSAVWRGSFREAPYKSTDKSIRVREPTPTVLTDPVPSCQWPASCLTAGRTAGRLNVCCQLHLCGCVQLNNGKHSPPGLPSFEP